ncbi:hypothetical protein HKCCE3408_00535 [Rhodobacterales bacterium HKCCE3408]|nr:hypothetical protein [Rhodobacterales bacterium HKCCE3408]
MAEDAPRSGAGKPGDWLNRLSRYWTGLGAISFAESTFLPIPLEVLVAPLMIGHPPRALSIAAVIWLGCLVGASAFYFVGVVAHEPVVLPVLRALDLTTEYREAVADLEGSSLFWSVFVISISPAPLHIATLGAGAVKGSYPMFLAAIALSRGLRYFGLAILAQFIGDRIAHLDVPKHIVLPAVMVSLLLAWAVWQFA